MEVVNVLDANGAELKRLREYALQNASETFLAELYGLHKTENEHLCKLFRIMTKTDELEEGVFTFPDEEDLNTVTGYVYGQHDDIERATDAMDALGDTFLTAFRVATGRLAIDEAEARDRVEEAHRAYEDALDEVNEALAADEEDVTIETVERLRDNLDETGDWAEWMPPRINFDGVPKRQ